MREAYLALKKEINSVRGLGPGCHTLIERLFETSREELAGCERIPLKSNVAGKSYFSFAKDKRKSRPVNVELFIKGNRDALDIYIQLLRGKRHRLSSLDITRAVYTTAMICCAGRDVASDGDQKTPGTIFEWLCAAVIQASLRVIPENSIEILNLDLKGRLPTDYVFDLGAEKPKFHLPVKTSTRERIIQVWAHQRMLDGVYGVGRFLAMPIILAETKLDTAKLEVTEICLPWQWRLYQMHIANLWNVCYLDAPKVYLDLDSKFPRIGVSTLGDLLVKGGRLDKLLLSHKLL
jgi:hypothetical protein